MFELPTLNYELSGIKLCLLYYQSLVSVAVCKVRVICPNRYHLINATAFHSFMSLPLWRAFHHWLLFHFPDAEQFSWFIFHSAHHPSPITHVLSPLTVDNTPLQTDFNWSPCSDCTSPRLQSPFCSLSLSPLSATEIMDNSFKTVYPISITFAIAFDRDFRTVSSMQLAISSVQYSLSIVHCHEGRDHLL